MVSTRKWRGRSSVVVWRKHSRRSEGAEKAPRGAGACVITTDAIIDDSELGFPLTLLESDARVRTAARNPRDMRRVFSTSFCPPLIDKHLQALDLSVEYDSLFSLSLWG